MTEAPARIPTNALVVLVGPSGAGKSTWARRWFRPDQVVASDAIRGLVGTGEHDQRAGTDAFDVLDLVLDRRLKRGLLTVVDSLGLDDKRRQGWIARARKRHRPVIAIAFSGDPKEFRARNSTRPHSVPSKVVTAQLKRWAEVEPQLAEEFDAVLAPSNVVIVPTSLSSAPEAAERQKDDPVTLSFGLHLSSFDWPGGTDLLGPTLARIGAEAEAAGFESLWVMDHMQQIPQVGRAWDPMLESYTALGFLAAATRSIRLGTMVTGVTYRNVGHLAKTIATLDVLSGGRAWCGIGAAWYEKEHRAYGWEFPADGIRLDLLEEALEALPLFWGPGAPAFDGTHLQIADATCYPRPIQDPLPILVGGSGERRTLKLVAQYANACNLFGEPEVVRRKIKVLAGHCEAIGRDAAEIEITQLSNVVVAADSHTLQAKVDALTSGQATAEETIERHTVGLADDHIGRFRQLHDAGVNTVVVSLADVAQPGAITDFAPIISAFRN